MLGSGIIDVAIGLAFVFGVTAALSSVFTELIARFLGLRGAYLLRGLRELLDSSTVATDLTKVKGDYEAWQNIMKGIPAEGASAGRAGTPAEGTSAGGTSAKVPSATGALLGSPILRSQGMTGQISSRELTLPAAEEGRPAPLPRGTRKARRSLPSYISATSFADALIDLMVPNAEGQTTMDAIKGSLESLQKELPPSVSPLVGSLQALVTSTGGDIKLFRISVENWYDDHMARVSGWYKRHVAKITTVIGAILVLLLNINTLTIGRTLYTNSVVRTAVSSVAAKTTSCQSKSQQDCLAGLQSQLSAATQAGLPIGWGTVADCAAPKASCNWLDQRGIFSRHGGSGWEIVLVLIGFLITIIALTPGARFWFDLLGKLGSLRTTGPKPTAPAS
jgi:hypothetical protein